MAIYVFGVINDARLLTQRRGMRASSKVGKSE